MKYENNPSFPNLFVQLAPFQKQIYSVSLTPSLNEGAESILTPVVTEAITTP